MNIEQIYNVINQENKKDFELESDLFCLKFAITNNNFQVFLHFLEDSDNTDNALEYSIKWASEFNNFHILDYLTKNYELTDECIIKGFYASMCYKKMDIFKYYFKTFRHSLLCMEVSKLLTQYCAYQEGIDYLFNIEAQEEQSYLDSIISSLDSKKALKI